MYKILIFLKKTDDEKITEHFQNYILQYLSDAAGIEIKAARVETSLLLDEKYSLFCELSSSSKEEMDRMMSQPAGKILNKNLTDFHQFISVIPVDYNN